MIISAVDCFGAASTSRTSSKRLEVSRVAIPSWGVGTGGTRFARFPGPGEPRNILEKLEDCSTICKLVRSTSAISLHIPWDKPDNAEALLETARSQGLTFDAMNSNTFQDQPGQKGSYKFGSLSHTDRAIRKQAIEHNIECIEIGRKLDSKALTVWVGDGSNFAGQSNFRHALDRYLESMHEIYAAVPDDWRAVHRTQAVRAGVLLDSDKRLGNKLLSAPRSWVIKLAVLSISDTTLRTSTSSRSSRGLSSLESWADFISTTVSTATTILMPAR